MKTYNENFNEFVAKIDMILAKNGHICSKHILNCRELYIRRQQRKYSKLPVSTFKSLNVPAAALKKLFTDEVVCKEVFDWVVNRDGEYPEDCWVLTENMPFETGIARTPENGEIVCHGVEVILCRSDKNSFGFTVKTVYPV